MKEFVFLVLFWARGTGSRWCVFHPKHKTQFLNSHVKTIQTILRGQVRKINHLHVIVLSIIVISYHWKYYNSCISPILTQYPATSFGFDVCYIMRPAEETLSLECHENDFSKISSISCFWDVISLVYDFRGYSSFGSGHNKGGFRSEP